MSRAVAAPTGRMRWLALVVLCVGQLMIVLDATVVNVALPVIQHDLGFSQASLAWVVNAYLISFGGLLLLAGRLGDLVGRRRVFLTGLGAFTVASLLCGLATSGAMLVAARFVQGIGAATMASMVLAILVTLFPEPRQTARAMSVYAFVASAGGSIGLLLGGVLVQASSWHWIFFVNLPIGVAASVLAVMLLPADEGAGLHHGVDVLGGVLVTATPSLAVYAILQAGDSGWLSARTLGLGSATVLLGALFVAWESRARTPLVRLGVFRSRTLVGANLLRMLFPVGLFGTFFLGVLYMQHALGYGALRTGLAFLPQTLMVGLFSLVLTRRVMDRLGARATIVIALSLVTAGLALFSQIPVGGAYVATVLPVTLVIGAGAGLFFVPSVALAMAGADREDAGIVSGLANVTLQIGAALGVATLASIATSHSVSLAAAGTSQVVALVDGYRLGFVIAAGCMLLAVAVAVTVLQPSRPRLVPAVETVPMPSVEPVAVDAEPGVLVTADAA